MSGPDLQRTIQAFDLDIRLGILRRPACNLAEIFRQAESLSGLYAPKNACRSLDLLHIAAAMQLRVTEFVTFDIRQKVVAREAGLAVVDRA